MGKKNRVSEVPLGLVVFLVIMITLGLIVAIIEGKEYRKAQALPDGVHYDIGCYTNCTYNKACDNGTIGVVGLV